MLQGLRAKFTQHVDLRAALLATGDALIIEHRVRDAYWGDGPDGRGKNRLGYLLMQLRKELAAAR
jgi:N-glycosidase YbiA